jgi:hypothetical protein
LSRTTLYWKSKNNSVHSDKKSFAESVKSTILTNRAAVQSGTLSAAEKKALTNENIDLMKSTGLKFASGGLVPKYFASGGYASGTDTVPAMLTPGEFVVSKSAVDKIGVGTLRDINAGRGVGGSYPTFVGNSRYYYNLSVNVRSDANPNEIAQTVMMQLRQIDAQRIRSNRF